MVLTVSKILKAERNATKNQVNKSSQKQKEYNDNIEDLPGMVDATKDIDI
jgi:hypothetical protein